MMLPEKKQILVVDDEANLRRVLTAQLSRDGYEVTPPRRRSRPHALAAPASIS
jgi:CheY-like chemotaxis protein